MTETNGTTAPAGRRRALIFFLLTGVAIWFGTAWLLHPTRVKVKLEAAITTTTGMNAEIGDFQYELYPQFRAKIEEVTLSNGDFEIGSTSIQIVGDLADVFQKKVTLSEFNVSDIHIELPEDNAAAQEKVTALIDALTQPMDPLDWKIVIPMVSLPTIHATQIGNPDSVAELAVSIQGLLADQSIVLLEGKLPAFGNDAQINAHWAFETNDQTLADVNGRLTLTNLDSQTLPIKNPPQALISLETHIQPQADALWAFDVIGRVYSEVDPHLDGPFSFNGDFQNENLAIEDIQWATSDVSLQANARYDNDSGTRIHLKSLHVENRATQLLVDQIQLDEAYFKTNPDALFSLIDTEFTVEADNEFSLARGTIEASGLSLYRINDDLLSDSISGSAKYTAGTLFIDSLTDGNISISGTLAPDFDKGLYAFDLKGNGDLEPKYWQTFTPAELISTLGGTVQLEQASGTYIRGNGIPEDLFIEGSLEKGQIVLDQQGKLNTLSPITARFSSTTQNISMTINGDSTVAGSFGIQGAYTMDNKTWRGTVNGSIQEWIEPYIKPEKQTRLIQAALTQLGTPDINLEVDLQQENRIQLALALESENDVSLNGTISWLRVDDDFVLEDIDAESTFEATPIAESLFEKTYLEGPARLAFSRSHSKKTYRSDIFLESVNVYLSEYVEKRPGSPLTITITGDADEEWVLDTIQIDCLNETLFGTYSDGKFSIPSTKIKAQNWTPLLPEGSTANGSIQISFAGDSKETHMVFDRFGFRINEDLQIDRIDGELKLADGIFQTPGLHLYGANSDCRVTAILKDDVWDGYLEGNSLDMNAVNVFLDAARALNVKEETPSTDGLPSESEPSSYWEKPYRINATIQLKELLYGRGHLEDINGLLRADHTGIYLEDFVINPKSGSLSGWASITPDQSQLDQFTLHADFNRFDTHVLDSMLFDSSRDLNGKVSGQIDFTAPRGPTKEMLAQGNGRADWIANDGTFGKMGFATKLLTALKTVNLINLRLPAMRDKGLTYNRFSGKAEMQNGIVQFHDTLLEETSYAMEVDGHINFATDETHVNTFVRVLEGVTKLAEKLPLIRKVAELTTKKIGVNVALTGSPYELNASVATPGKSSQIGKPVTSTVKLGTSAVKGAGKASKNAIKKVVPKKNVDPA